jgi:hypothetical protein
MAPRYVGITYPRLEFCLTLLGFRFGQVSFFEPQT